MVLEFCSVIAEGLFSAPPNCNRQPGDCEQAIFSTTNLQPTARRSTAWLFVLPVFVFGHFAGLALPAPHSG
jgi:hypothetical protein